MNMIYDEDTGQMIPEEAIEATPEQVGNTIMFQTGPRSIYAAGTPEPTQPVNPLRQRIDERNALVQAWDPAPDTSDLHPQASEWKKQFLTNWSNRLTQKGGSYDLKQTEEALNDELNKFGQFRGYIEGWARNKVQEMLPAKAKRELEKGRNSRQYAENYLESVELGEAGRQLPEPGPGLYRTTKGDIKAYPESPELRRLATEELTIKRDRQKRDESNKREIMAAKYRETKYPGKYLFFNKGTEGNVELVPILKNDEESIENAMKRYGAPYDLELEGQAPMQESMPPQAPPPQMNQPKPLTREIALQLLQQSGGDKNKARELAKQQGFTW